LSGPDVGLEAVEQRETLRRGLAALPERERRIIALRFVGDMTQKQIATRIGMSQMQVSRLLTRSLAQLRDGLRDDADTGPRNAGRADAMYQVNYADTVGGG
jgi:RNA polymerase sigma-B factor